MNARTEPFVKLFHDDADEFNDPLTFGAWGLLKVGADQSYPNAAPIPRWCKKALLERFAARIDVVGDRYRIPTLDADRAERSGSASNAATIRWAREHAAGNATRNANGNADGNADGVPSKSKSKTQTQTRSYPSDDAARVTEADAAWGRLTSSKWLAIREALIERGLRFPPSGDPDVPGTQANVIWPIVDAGPKRAAAWIREAPPGDAFSVFGYLIKRWGDLPPPDDLAPVRRPRGPRVDGGGLTRIGDVMGARS